MKKAIVIGGTGMVGIELIKQLIQNPDFSEIISFVRRPSGIVHPKLNEYQIDFDLPEKWEKLVVGDVLFSTLGTTLAKAKSKDAQFKVDFEYQYKVAEIASKNGVSNYVLVSSAGANASSGVFYSSIKGKLEDAVKSLPFEVISILRPGQLAGNRNENRVGERMGLSVMYFLNKIGLFRRYKPIQASQVAQAMIHAANKTISSTYILGELFRLAE